MIADYDITYAPPMSVKDEPHRVFDTLDGWAGAEEIPSKEWGVVTICGDEFEIESFEIKADNSN